MDEQSARRDLIRICQLMYERSYVVSSDGNVSVQLDDGRVLATPTMTCKGRMTDDLIAITDLEGRSLNDRRASSELAMRCSTRWMRFRSETAAHSFPELSLSPFFPRKWASAYEAFEDGKIEASRLLLEESSIAATGMRGWGGEVAERCVRFVFSAEPIERLKTIPERLDGGTLAAAL